jgi:beta-glucosidase
MKRIFLLFLVTFLFLQVKSQVYKDKNASTEERVESMLSAMTLSEKLSYIGGVDGFYIRNIPRLGLPRIKMSDGPLGVRTYGSTTAYPAGILVASTWDRDLVKQMGQSLGKDARARGVHILLAPGVNMYRAPMCGRNFEYFGEDPYLSGQMAVSYIKGVQSQNVVATVKHYAANNQEWDRYNVSSDVTERALREIYLPAFKAAVIEGKVGAVMNSYNLINGVHATQHIHLNNEILKGDWNFDGILMSDWGSTHNGISAALGGLDLEMPAADFMKPATLQDAIDKGRIKEELINDKVRRILRIIFRFGFYDNVQTDNSIPLDNPESSAKSLEVARAGIVLLKNQDSILPLSPKKIKSLAVMGPNSNIFNSGGGSSYPTPFHYVSILQGIKDIAGKDVTVNFVGQPAPNEIAQQSVFYTSEGSEIKGLTANYFKNQTLSGNADFTRIDTMVDFHWANEPNVSGFPADHFSIRWTGVVRPSQSGSHVFSVKGDDGFRLWVNDHLIIDNWVDEAYTQKQAQIYLTKGYDYNIKLEYYENAGLAEITLGYYPESASETEILAAATSSDAVVICAGFNSTTESEGFDRPFKLGIAQDSLITKVTRVNPNTIVILEAGGNVDMSPWINQIKGLIHAFYPGQEGGTAIGEIIFGITNPSGKLPATFEKNLEDNPTFTNYYINWSSTHVKYNEGVFLGYRNYDSQNIEPLFPFGFGLSYTDFNYGNLNVVADTVDGKIKFTVSFDITNSGNVAGAEIAQLYVGQAGIEIRPFKELKGFTKVQLNAGETKTVTIELDENAFAWFKTDLNTFGVDQADFQLLIGASSRDIRLQYTVHINQSQLLSGVSELKNGNSTFRIYPSPANNLLFFETSGNFTGSILSIYDISGRKKDEFTLSGHEHQYNSSKLENGIYIFKLVGNNEVTTKKIVIEH